VKKNVFALFVALALLSPALGALAKEAALKSRFVFKLPDGWTDKTPPEARATVRLAFDEPNHLAFQAKVAPGAEPVTLEFLDKYILESQKAVRRITGAELKVIKKDGFDVDGIIAARFIFETPPPPDRPEAAPARQLQYYVPVADQHALMTFTAPAATFDKYIELFDKTARATQVKK
jgi:hypothetical protein